VDDAVPQAQGSTREREERDNSELVLQGLLQMPERARSSGTGEVATTAAPTPFFRDLSFLRREGAGGEWDLKRHLHTSNSR